MVRVTSRIVCSVLAGFALWSPASAATSSAQQAVPGSYIVEFEDSDQSPDIFYSTLSRSNIGVTRRLDLSSSLFKGASFQLDDVTNEKSALDAIASLGNVKRITPNYIYSLPDDKVWSIGGGAAARDPPSERSETPETPYAPHVMTGVDKLHKEGYTGKGIKIAIIDSGVDYTHPDLGGCFGEGCKISFGYDIVGDDYVPGLPPQPDDDPYDNCHGHGTHVAGIIASNMNSMGFSGVAPNVEIGMFRALGCADQATNDVLIAAYTMAFESGADIISASIGDENGWSEGPLGEVLRKIEDAGVHCSVSIGNSGVLGVFSTNSPGDSFGAAGVASVENSDIPVLSVEGTYEADGSDATSFLWTPPDPPSFSNGTYPLYAFNYNTTAADDACLPLPANTPDMSEYLVLIRVAETCQALSQMKNLADAGVRFLMFYSNSAGTLTLPSEAYNIKGVGMVKPQQGEEWISMLAEGIDINVQITDPAVLATEYGMAKNTDTGGYLSTFTSWGPTFDLQLKPQFGAPGGQILSSYPVDLGGYAVMSGTSMACPFVAGAMALILEARGKTDTVTMNSLLASTANPTVYFDWKKPHTYLAPVMQQGAGLISAYDALHSGTILSVSSISFNDTEFLNSDANFTIQNLGKEAVTYKISHSGGITVYTLNNSGTPVPFPFGSGITPEVVEETAELEFSSTSITVAAGESEVVVISPTPPKGLNEERIPVYGGYISLNGTNGDSLSLPYVGVASALRDATILNTYLDLVYLGSSTGRVEAGHVFTLPPPDSPVNANDTSIYPKLWAGLGLGTRILRVDIKAAPSSMNDALETEEVLGDDIVGSMYGYPSYYVSRAIEDGTLWYGKMDDGEPIPTGNYTLVIKALKIFGDEENPDDYERVETPEFRIQYRDDVF
ncbi:hypothetical protein FQN54_002980 [Arachnomyces sp. PD_36]|nr:hypothetical protein FQN54_002980 [Arachnomyces sp. PD_36]